MKILAIIGWIVFFTIIISIFVWLWKLACKIEREEHEEQQWKDFLENLWRTDPYQAYLWQQEFEKRFKLTR